MTDNIIDEPVKSFKTHAKKILAFQTKKFPFARQRKSYKLGKPQLPCPPQGNEFRRRKKWLNVKLLFQPLLRCLAEYTSDAAERNRLLALCSKAGAADYMSTVRGQSLCLLDILLALPSCQPPLERILEHLPRLQPRPYSAASVLGEDKTVDFVFNVVEIPQDDGTARMFPRTGLCTGWIEAEKRDKEKVLNNHPSRLTSRNDAFNICLGIRLRPSEQRKFQASR